LRAEQITRNIIYCRSSGKGKGKDHKLHDKINLQTNVMSMEQRV